MSLKFLLFVLQSTLQTNILWGYNEETLTDEFTDFATNITETTENAPSQELALNKSSTTSWLTKTPTQFPTFTDPPTPTEMPTYAFEGLPDCTYIPEEFNAGFGDCSIYTEYVNFAFCDEDIGYFIIHTEFHDKREAFLI